MIDFFKSREKFDASDETSLFLLGYGTSLTCTKYDGKAETWTIKDAEKSDTRNILIFLG